MMDESPYDVLAACYDRLQDEMDYEAWAKWLLAYANNHLAQAGSSAGHFTWLDLGCGTGAFLLALAEAGQALFHDNPVSGGRTVDYIGIDHSQRMLTEAQGKFDRRDPLPGVGTQLAGEGEFSGEGQFPDVLFLKQDIRDFELHKQVDVCTILLDTVNHLPGHDDVLVMLKQCYQFMKPGALLIFDLISEYHAAHVLGDDQFFVIDDTFSLFWENTYDPIGKRTQAELLLFEEDPVSGLYQRHEAVVREQVYTENEIRALLTEAGFELLTVREPLSGRLPAADASRVVYFVRK